MTAPRRRSWILAGLALVVGCAALVVGGSTAFDALYYRHYVITGMSMTPDIHPGSTLWGRPIDDADVKRGEVVLLKPPSSAGISSPLVVRRVVAVGGDTVAVLDNHLMLNGRIVPEPYLGPGVLMQPVGLTSVPKGEVYVLGDFRQESVDSRQYGPVPVANISQKVVATNAASLVRLLVRGGICLVVLAICSLIVVRFERRRRRPPTTATPEDPITPGYHFR